LPFLFILIFFQQNGYTFLLDDLKNCDPNNIVNIENAEIKMDADCNLVMSASGSSQEGFQNAEVGIFLKTLS
jgi:hypothetical protein